MGHIFFNSWENLVRSAIITVLAYIGMIVILRISGKRTLSKMNAYDFIITIALGSSMATVALNKDVSLTQGLLVFGMFTLLQYSITKLSLKVKGVKNIITNSPSLLLYKGNVLQQSLQKERITVDELYAAARKKGFQDLTQIDAIVLESTGVLSIIKNASLASGAMKDVEQNNNEI